MCNLYSLTKGQKAILDATRAMIDRTGNLPLYPAIFPDYAAPIVRRMARSAIGKGVYQLIHPPSLSPITP